jgi:GcrA cell cycle regulator
MRYEPYDWAKPRVAFLRQVWPANQSATAVARELTEKFGQPITRSAVIGKVNRLGLADRPARPPKPRRKVTAKAEPPPPALMSLFDLTDETCRWPIRHPRQPSYGFCGAPGALLSNHRPYCPFHHRIAHDRY